MGRDVRELLKLGIGTLQVGYGLSKLLLCTPAGFFYLFLSCYISCAADRSDYVAMFIPERCLINIKVEKFSFNIAELIESLRFLRLQNR